MFLADDEISNWWGTTTSNGSDRGRPALLPTGKRGYNRRTLPGHKGPETVSEVVIKHHLHFLMAPHVALQGEEASPLELTEEDILGGIETEVPTDLVGEEEGTEGKGDGEVAVRKLHDSMERERRREEWGEW